MPGSLVWTGTFSPVIQLRHFLSEESGEWGLIRHFVVEGYPVHSRLFSNFFCLYLLGVGGTPSSIVIGIMPGCAALKLLSLPSPNSQQKYLLRTEGMGGWALHVGVSTIVDPL